MARRLGLDAKALLTEDEPRFVWKVGKFKNLSGASDAERVAIVSFASSFARSLLASVPEAPETDLAAANVRKQLLASTSTIALGDVVTFCWALGIPVIYLKTFPLSAKKMCAVSVRVRDRFAILLARESRFPAQVAYYVAHELGHIALGHLEPDGAVIDIKDPLRTKGVMDPEEDAANRYALELLTGDPAPEVLTEAKSFTAAGLASAAAAAASELGIEAGTLVLCFGHTTGKWDKAIAALKRLYPHDKPLAPVINRVALAQLTSHGLSGDSEEYARAVMGEE